MRTGSKETSIDHRWQSFNSRFLNSKDERRRGGSPFGEVEPLGVGRDQKADKSDTENIEPELMISRAHGWSWKGPYSRIRM